MAKSLNWPVVLLSLLAYLSFYSYFTGLAQLFRIPYPVGAPTAYLGQMVGEFYTGPVLQIFWGEYLLNLKLLPIPVAVALATLFAINSSLIWFLYRRRLLRACLLAGAGGGIGGMMASVASFSYACCGWPLSLGIMGASLTSVLSPYLTATAFILLAYNAYILRARIRSLAGVIPAS